MRIRDLIEATSWPEAVRIFKKLTGVDPVGLSKAELQKHFRDAARKLHPDRSGGDTRPMQDLNDAYDVLKAESHSDPTHGGRPSDYSYQAPPRNEPTPEWAWAGHSGGMPHSSRISREDYRDINFIKKRMWELSGKSRRQYTITGFDGSFLRHSVTVFGSPEIFDEMAKAMVMWQTRGGNSYPCRAVIVTTRGSKTVKLIWADGRSYADNPIEIEHESFNDNPGNDRHFLADLRRTIDGMEAA